MSENLPHQRDADDATHDDAPPTDAASDEVKSDAAGSAASGTDVTGEIAPGPEGSTGPDSGSSSPGGDPDAPETTDADASDALAEAGSSEEEADVPGLDDAASERREPGTSASAPADAS
jgi:hypothetical protein